MKPRPIWLVNCALIASIGIGACGRTPSPGLQTQVLQPASPSPVIISTVTSTPTPHVVQGTVSIWHSLEEAHLPALLKRVAAFQALYPDVQFDVLYIPRFDLRQAFETAAGEGGGPTILIAPADWGPVFFDRGWVADLSEYAGPQLRSRLNQAALSTGRYRGAQISLPLTIDGVVLYRNRSIIPKAAATLQELIELAQAATRAETVGADLERSFFYSAGHLYGLGGSLMTEEGLPVFNDRHGVEWLELLLTFSQAGPTEYLSDNDLALFKNGGVGFLIDATWNRSSLAESIGPENLAIDPWPLHSQGNLSGFVMAESLYLVTPGTRAITNEDREASWSFIDYFLMPESQADLAGVGLIPSLDASHLQQLRAIDATDQGLELDSLIEQAMVALAEGVAYPVNPEISLYNSPMDIALKAVFEGELSAETALQMANDLIISSIENLRATPTPSPTP